MLIETFVRETLDIRELLSHQSIDPSQASPFLPSRVLSLIAARKLLQEALIHRNKRAPLEEVASYQYLAAKFLLQNALNVSVPQAAMDLVKVDMVVQLASLCARKINCLHWVQEAAMKDIEGKLKLELSSKELDMMDEEKQECLIFISEVLEEIHRRIVLIESPPKEKEEPLLSRYDAINLL